MKEIRNEIYQQSVNECGSPPNISASKIGLVSRDYYKGDFSSSFGKILKLLDEKGCDTALFSLYAFLEMEKADILGRLAELRLKNIKNIFVELSQGKLKDYLDMENKEKKAPLINMVYSKNGGIWQQYPYQQVFGSRTQKPAPVPPLNLHKYVEDFSNKRIMGNVAVVLCGETNIVKLFRKTEIASERVVDDYNFLKVVPENQIIFNPIHDRMTRYEMKKKREFLSKGGRWVLSVWNKGKKFGKAEKTRDGESPPWTVFYNGVEVPIKAEPLNFDANQDIVIGIIDTTNKRHC